MRFDPVSSLILAGIAGPFLEVGYQAQAVQANQCLAIDPVEHPVVTEVLKSLHELQNERLAAVSGRSQSALAAELVEVQAAQADFARLHGNREQSADFDREIALIRSKLRPMLVVHNPNAREIVAALLQSPDGGLIVVFDEEVCEELAKLRPVGSHGRLARTLARGFRGEELLLPASGRGVALTFSAPALTIFFLAQRNNLAQLLGSPAFAKERLTEGILVVPKSEAQVQPESRAPSLEGLVRQCIAGRDRGGAKRYTLEVTDEAQRAIEKPVWRSVMKVAAAFQLSTDAHQGAVSAAVLAHAWKFVEDCAHVREAMLKEAYSTEPGRILLEKIRRIGPCTFRQLVRCYHDQRRSTHEEPLNQLIASGLLVRESTGQLRYADDRNPKVMKKLPPASDTLTGV